MNALLAALLLGLVPLASPAQTIYRCGNTYTQQPCPEAKVIEADDPRSPAQTAEARKLAADERQRADEMERERALRERTTPTRAASLSAPAPRAKAASAPHPAFHKKPHKHRLDKAPRDDDFAATPPGGGKKRPQLREPAQP